MAGKDGCRFANKQRHSTYDAAVAHRKWLREARGANDDLSVYQCGDHWHVGHDPQVFAERIRSSIRESPRRRRQHR